MGGEKRALARSPVLLWHRLDVELPDGAVAATCGPDSSARCERRLGRVTSPVWANNPNTGLANGFPRDEAQEYVFAGIPMFGMERKGELWKKWSR